MIAVRWRYRLCVLAVAAVVLGAFACGGSQLPRPDGSGSPASDAAGRQNERVEVVDAAPDGSGPWKRMTIEGVSFDIPGGPEWRIDVVGNPCSDQLERWVVMENQMTHDRVQIKFAQRAVAADFAGPESKLDQVTARIQGSFAGSRTLEGRARNMLPFPTSPACNPATLLEVPTLAPLHTPEPQVTVIVEPTWTPVVPPSPTGN